MLAIPACVIEFPLMRYRSQLYFAEILMMPLTLVLLLDHLRRANRSAIRQVQSPSIRVTQFGHSHRAWPHLANNVDTVTTADSTQV